MIRIAISALAAFVLLPAGAQSPGYTPTPAEVKQARDNVQRDAKLANEMEKARLRDEARTVPLNLPPPQEPAFKETTALRKPEVFTAKVPGSGKKPAEKKKPAKKRAKKA